MENTRPQTPGTRIDKDHLSRLKALAEAASEERGPGCDDVQLPARIVIDFDPWALSIDMVATRISPTVLRAQCNLAPLPPETERLLSVGDIYRIQLDGVDLPLPLLPAKLEQIVPPPDGSGNMMLRLKWMLDHHGENQLRKFLKALNDEKGGSLS
ncbi:MAG: hypothetical protein RIQ81_1378 [Pseudomonadota bacterium]|jgi:hypothetical protein